MSPRQVIAALIHRHPTPDEPDDLEQWVADLANPDPAADLTTPTGEEPS